MMIVALPLTSCIQDEPLNMEADIEAVIFDKNNNHVLLFNNDSVIEIPSDDAGLNISVIKNPQAEITNIAPIFRLSPGARITHIETGKDGNRLPLDFTKPQKYKVTSEDGKWERYYTLSFDNPSIFTDFNFEHYEMLGNGKYISYYEVKENSPQKYYIWATGNPGYSMSGGSNYPTQKYDRGVNGNAVVLKTVSTGMFGSALKMPIAAGNLFFGSFDSKNAVTAPLAATRFGIPFNKKPIKLTGYYMYIPGEQMTDQNNQPIESMTDAPDIYVVMYENSEIVDGVKKSVMLYGNNILNASNIVGRARKEEGYYQTSTREQIYNGEWNTFSIDFTEEGNGIDMEKLANYEYNLALVFTSSIYGANFQGAVGSELYIDNVKLICEE